MAEYRLQALLQIRERAEEQAKEAFARAVQQVREEEAFLKELEGELQRMIEDRHRRRKEYSDKLASGQMKILDQAAASRFVERLKELEAEQQGRIDGQRDTVREAEKLAKRAQDALIAASQDLKALVKHKEKWAEERRRERMMKDEEMLDEIAQTIHQQQGKDS
ncbi:MAG: hypothetical protein H6729_08770 [Deltaproteobacteria bacterium]|nr:hypothetical protein [Deltaproteobacteria bacterium]